MNGQKYGRLTVLAKSGRTKDGHITWRCICECGEEAVIAGSRLRNGYVRWVNGFFDKRRGTYTPPLPECSREPRYAD